MMLLKVDITSDTHNWLPRLPGGDLLIHSGDATMSGNARELEAFAQYLNALKYRKIIFVPGNHDFEMDNNLSQMKKYFDPKVEILINQSFSWNGLNFYGSPYVPILKEWAFGKTYAQRKQMFSHIPDSTEVLITHVPPFETLDASLVGERLGCLALKERLASLPNVFLHVFGHIHNSYGVKETPGRVSINASYGYRNENKPLSIIINTDTKTVESIDLLDLT
jgi:Icc-related predicted phosphoesterase